MTEITTKDLTEKEYKLDADFDFLIDCYSDACRHGTASERTEARRALRQAFREALKRQPEQNTPIND